MASLVYAERRASSERADGLLILHHGRGTSEYDLLPLADVFDPQQRLHVVSARGPLHFPGSPGYHWYTVPRVGYPDADTFRAAYRQLAALHDELWEQTGLTAENTVLGGFSMGTVMSYALGLGADRPGPAGILALSGFIPTVEGWEPSLADRTRMRVLIAHGRNDPVIDVSFARLARELLGDAGFEIDYRESDAVHTIDPGDVPRIVGWLGQALPMSAA